MISIQKLYDFYSETVVSLPIHNDAKIRGLVGNDFTRITDDNVLISVFTLLKIRHRQVIRKKCNTIYARL